MRPLSRRSSRARKVGKRHAKAPASPRAIRRKGGAPRARAFIAAGAIPAMADRAARVKGALSVREFLAQAEAEPLAGTERERIIDQALLLLQEFYVHLPLKRAMHACEPVQRLRLLRSRHPGMSDRRFHDEMIDIVSGLRDLHTNYVLPRPYKGKVAVLPFMLEDFHEGGTRLYLVTKVLRGIGDPDFQPGAEVTHWNGVPIGRVVELSAAREPGSNEEARHARGLERLTVRALGLSAPPDEEWVIIGYRQGVVTKEVRLAWQVLDPEAETDGDAGEGLVAQLQGVDLQRQIVSRVRKQLFARPAMRRERRFTAARARGVAAAEAADLDTASVFPNALSFKKVAGNRYGYIRIWTFAVPDEIAFAQEVRRICALLPPDGLILDVRGNGGGYIRAGEMLLQLFTPRSIEPERFHFINSARTLALCQIAADLQPWAESIRQAVETGAVYSQGFPLTNGAAANSLGQAYVGPVVLITDALCYSTTDIFAAGFQDHDIGPVLGVHGNTGAGGANVWTHELLRAVWNDPEGPLEALPKGATMRLALRQSTRVARRLGMPLEDLGVVPDRPVHHMTRADVLDGNRDLIAAAAAVLDALPRRRLDAQLAPSADGVTLKLTTINVDRIDVFADGRATATLDIVDGASTHTLRPRNGTAVLEIRGFQQKALVAMRRLPMP